MLTCFESFGQVYEKIYAESNQVVQSKIDQNKMNGIEILTDVITSHQIGMSGLSISQKTALENSDYAKFYEFLTEKDCQEIQNKLFKMFVDEIEENEDECEGKIKDLQDETYDTRAKADDTFNFLTEIGINPDNIPRMSVYDILNIRELISKEYQPLTNKILGDPARFF
jgi:hypothetical protein